MEFIRVTEALSRYSDYCLVPPAILACACDRGTRIHKYCELYAKNMLYEDVDWDCLPYVQAFVNWFDDVVEKCFVIEKRFYCEKLWITGQIDLVCKIRGDKCLSVVDYKSTAFQSKTWNLQTAAYKHLADLNGYQSDRRLILQLHKDETFFLHEFTSHKEELEIFVGCLNAHRFMS